MADLSSDLEVLENRFMRAWMRKDASEIRKLAARDCTMMFGTSRPQILDRPSFVKAIERDFKCHSYRFSEALVKRYGRLAWYSAAVDLELELRGQKWAGTFLATDLWRKSRMTRKWMLVERSLAPVDGSDKLTAAILKMQLWA